MVTNYIIKSYNISGKQNCSRIFLVIYTKKHIFTNFNAPKKFPYPLHLAFCFALHTFKKSFFDGDFLSYF